MDLSNHMVTVINVFDILLGQMDKPLHVAGVLHSKLWKARTAFLPTFVSKTTIYTLYLQYTYFMYIIYIDEVN